MLTAKLTGIAGEAVTVTTLSKGSRLNLVFGLSGYCHLRLQPADHPLLITLIPTKFHSASKLSETTAGAPFLSYQLTTIAGQCSDSSITQEVVRKRQSTMAEAVPSVQLLVEEGSESSVVLHLLMYISDFLQVTEDYIAQQREAEVRQIPVRLVHLSMNDLQPDLQSARQERSEETTDVMVEMQQKMAHGLRRTPWAAVYTTNDDTETEEELETQN